MPKRTIPMKVKLTTLITEGEGDGISACPACGDIIYGKCVDVTIHVGEKLHQETSVAKYCWSCGDYLL